VRLHLCRAIRAIQSTEPPNYPPSSSTHYHPTTTPPHTPHTGLKAQGKYLARTLSFAETTFNIQQVPLEADFKTKYDKLAQVWYSVLEIMHEAGADLQRGTASYAGSNALPYGTGFDQHLRSFSSQYWGAHLRFFRHITVAAKVPFIVDLAKKALAGAFHA
jgi:hypothetical protein